jgi:hypothetical protein
MFNKITDPVLANSGKTNKFGRTQAVNYNRVFDSIKLMQNIFGKLKNGFTAKGLF